MIKSKFNYEPISIKIGIIFAKLGISPNLWSIGAIIPAVLGFLSLAFYHDLTLGVIFFIISGLIDVVDGAVARVSGNVTPYGAFLDGIVDRYVEILLYVGLLFFYLSLAESHEFLLPNSIWVSLLIFGALMPTYVRAYADHKGVITEEEDQKRMGGLLERFERMTLIFIGMLAGGYFNLMYLTYMIVITAILSNLTALQRILFVVLKTK